jgi:hypothetical protein
MTALWAARIRALEFTAAERPGACPRPKNTNIGLVGPPAAGKWRDTHYFTAIAGPRGRIRARGRKL